MPRKKLVTSEEQSSSHDLLVQTANTVDLLHSRLFGGDGQIGALAHMYQQQKELTEKLDSSKRELLDRIDAKKKDVDEDIKNLADKHESLNIKVNWFAGGLASLGTAATLLLGYIGIHNKG